GSSADRHAAGLMAAPGHAAGGSPPESRSAGRYLTVGRRHDPVVIQREDNCPHPKTRSRHMSSSVLYMSMSLDGYIAGPDDEPGNPGGDGFMRLHEWYYADGE